METEHLVRKQNNAALWRSVLQDSYDRSSFLSQKKLPGSTPVAFSPSSAPPSAFATTSVSSGHLTTAEVRAKRKEKELELAAINKKKQQQQHTQASLQFDDHFDSSENLIAGAISGLIAETVMHAFDTVSHRAKVHPSSLYGNFSGAFKLIWRQEGIRGYFAGVSATIAQAPPANATYFFCYEALKSLGLKLTNNDPGTASAVYFLSGACSEIASSVLFVPLEVAKARLQLGANPSRATGGLVPHETNFHHLHRALAGIYQENGIRGLTAGWQAGLALDAAFSGLQFCLYEQCKKTLRDVKQRELTTGETLFAGCVSGGIAAAITNPLDCITSRIQSQVGGTPGYGSSFRSVLRNTIAEGPIALWRGTLPRVMQVAPLSALSFGIYEAGRRFLKDTALFRDSSEAAAGGKLGDS
jgi:Mitochondrial carrier protein